MSMDAVHTEAAAGAEPLPPSHAGSDLPPTNNVVLQAARSIDVTDRAAVVADVARSQTMSAHAVFARQRHEIEIGRGNDMLRQIQADMQAIRDRAAIAAAEINRQAEEDIQLEMAKARSINKTIEAAHAAIAVLDAG